MIIERRVNVIFRKDTEKAGMPESIHIEAPDVTMEECRGLLMRAADYVVFKLIRDSIMRELQGPKIVSPGQHGMVGIDPRRLRQ